MRKVTSGLFTSVDGVVQDPYTFQYDSFDAELKAGDGGDIAVTGSVTLVRHLLFAGLLDELQLMVHPAIAGAGRKLFEPTDPPTRLRLVQSVVTSKGNVLSTSAPFAD